MFICLHLQITASTQPAAVPAPPVVAEVKVVDGSDPEKAKQLAEAVAEQVRSLACSEILPIHQIQIVSIICRWNKIESAFSFLQVFFILFFYLDYKTFDF